MFIPLLIWRNAHNGVTSQRGKKDPKLFLPGNFGELYSAISMNASI